MTWPVPRPAPAPPQPATAGAPRPQRPAPQHPGLPTPHCAAFTLVEILIVIAILGLLATLIFTMVNGRKAVQKRVYDTFTDTCLTTAEQRRNYVTNTVSLPVSCAAIGATPPVGLSATIQQQDTNYVIQVSGTGYSRQVTLPIQIQPTP